jgi:flagellar assembly protein FliH
MISSAKSEAEKIIYDAKMEAFDETRKQADEAQAVKQNAEDIAQRIIEDAKTRAQQLEDEMRQTLTAERADALEQGKTEGKDEGYADGKKEVDRLIERTHVILKRAKEKRGEILKKTEKEIVDLVLLITRKVIKVLSENQRSIIIQNVIEALRKVKSKGSVIIRVNLSDLELATEHKQDFINVMEGAKSVLVMEDSSVDKGGCIIETDFGEIDARIASQLAELESRILEISPIRSSVKENTPPPVVRTANLNADLAATSSLMSAKSLVDSMQGQSSEDNMLKDAMSMIGGRDASGLPDSDSEETELSAAANAALTASAALAAIATMATKGKRESDKLIMEKFESMGKRKTDQDAAE